jgi:hypothetical protein
LSMVSLLHQSDYLNRGKPRGCLQVMAWLLESIRQSHKASFFSMPDNSIIA